MGLAKNYPLQHCSMPKDLWARRSQFRGCVNMILAFGSTTCLNGEPLQPKSWQWKPNTQHFQYFKEIHASHLHTNILNVCGATPDQVLSSSTVICNICLRFRASRKNPTTGTWKGNYGPICGRHHDAQRLSEIKRHWQNHLCGVSVMTTWSITRGGPLF